MQTAPRKTVRQFALAFTLIAASLQLSGCAGLYMTDPHETAQEWVGYNANTLLARWHGAKPVIFQNKQETGYYYRFGTNGGTYNDTHYAAQGVDGNGQMVMGQQGGQVYTPARTDCELTFYTNQSGVITRYVLQGSDGRCAKYVNAWGGPTKLQLF